MNNNTNGGTMSKEKKEKKTRPFVGIDKQDGKWGLTTLQVVEGTDEVVSRVFTASEDNYKSAAIIALESAIHDSRMTTLED